MLDVTGCESRQQIRDTLDKRARGLSGILRLTVKGDLEPALDLDEGLLRDFLSESFDALQIRIGDLRSGYDIEAIRREGTVRGQFVNDVLNAGLDEQTQRRTLITGLRALDDRNDLEVL